MNNLNKEILNNALKSDNSPNLLIYPGYGEKIFYENFNNIYKIFDIQNIKCGEMSYTRTKYYYEFNMKNIITINIKPLTELLKEIIISKDFYSNNNKIIIFKNFNNIKIAFQNILRVITEKYRETTVFIFLTDKYSNIIEPLKSRSLSLRFSGVKDKEKRKIIYRNSDKTLKTPKYYDFMYSIKKEDIVKIIDRGNEIEKYINPYDKISLEILKIYNSRINKTNLLKLKDLAYNILKNNINVTIFYHNLLNHLLQNKIIRDNTKYKLVTLFSDSQYNFIKSYRSIIIIESLLINIYFTIKDDLPAYHPEPRDVYDKSS
jgi:DNA polymerase III delta prime subunit